MNRRVVVNGLRVFWIVIILWYELEVLFNSVRQCDWPDALSEASSHRHDALSHVLLVADPQILDIVDLMLRKNWWVALHKRPNALIFLGDMMDEGRFNMSDDECERYYRRFKSIFSLPFEIPTYLIPGSHDIGLRTSSSFSPYAHAR
ncbi:hypothetical protein D9615_004536 [Tricholomella constricta]|uniref:Calcineurin-like phosphoesterase domain-containing protein n=1 Tax=Tricholomella constricta TaxID=117010 RepID=A0A8H5HC43_9AGAR|nr:hypothetical protein D9615_004536 [Tricholomella constricta]